MTVSGDHSMPLCAARGRVSVMDSAQKVTGKPAGARPNREGKPWRRKDGRWQARAYPPGGGIDTRPRYVYGKTRREAMDKRADLEATLAQGLPEDPHQTVADAFARWLGTTLPQYVRAGRMAVTTMDSYRDNARPQALRPAAAHRAEARPVAADRRLLPGDPAQDDRRRDPRRDRRADPQRRRPRRPAEGRAGRAGHPRPGRGERAASGDGGRPVVVLLAGSVPPRIPPRRRSRDALDRPRPRPADLDAGPASPAAARRGRPGHRETRPGTPGGQGAEDPRLAGAGRAARLRRRGADSVAAGTAQDADGRASVGGPRARVHNEPRNGGRAAEHEPAVGEGPGPRGDQPAGAAA